MDRAVIDLGPELLVDGSAVRDPYVRLMAAVAGRPLACGSAWVVVGKRAAAQCRLPWGGAAAAVAGRGRARRAPVPAGA